MFMAVGCLNQYPHFGGGSSGFLQDPDLVVNKLKPFDFREETEEGFPEGHVQGVNRAFAFCGGVFFDPVNRNFNRGFGERRSIPVLFDNNPEPV